VWEAKTEREAVSVVADSDMSGETMLALAADEIVPEI